MQILTDRLELRQPVEADRSRFVALFCDEEFMVFSAGVQDVEGANRRFDRMLREARLLPFAKQPVIERTSGLIVGYAGVGPFSFEGEDRLEFGWRLIPAARGKGYATEASQALLAKATDTYGGEIVAIIDPTNLPSQNVARKLGFTFWKCAFVNGFWAELYRLQSLNP